MAEGGGVRPLRITATMRRPVTFTTLPVTLDGLLAAAVARLRDLDPSMGIVPIEIPVQLEPGGRFHLASCAQVPGPPVFSMLEYTHRRAPIEWYAELGGDKLRRVETGSGPDKAYRMPHHSEFHRTLTWWCIGEQDSISELLRGILHIGKDRSRGMGRRRDWAVEPCEAWDGFPVVRNGEPLRPLPVDWPGLVDPHLAYHTLTYPYHDHSQEQIRAIPRPH